MGDEIAPVATVTGLYRGTFSGLEPLTKDTPLTLDEVRRNPLFYELELHPEQEKANLIIDVIYDNMSPLRLQNLMRGMNRRISEESLEKNSPGFFDCGSPAGRPVLAGLVRDPALPGDARHRRPQGLPALAGHPHGADPDREAEAGTGPGLQPGERRLHKPGV